MGQVFNAVQLFGLRVWGVQWVEGDLSALGPTWHQPEANLNAGSGCRP